MDDMDLPERVREARKRLGLTQEQFAERAGVKHRAYQMFETRATKRPQPANLRKILRAAGIDPGDEHGDGEPANGDIALFLEAVEIWLTNMEPALRQRMIRELMRGIFSGEFTQMGIVQSSVSHG